MRLLIIPWFNASSKHIHKYVEEYIRLGFKKENIDIFNYKTNITYTYYHKIYKESISKQKKYDIVHSFSGGSLIQCQLQLANWNFDKIIYDSGPMFPTIKCVTNYLISSNIVPKSFENISNKTMKTVWNLEKINSDVKRYSNNIQPIYNNIIFPNDKPKLLFNSKSDNIILLDEIIKLNDKNTTKILYENSPHVQHMKYNQDHYIQTLSDFIYI